MSTRSKRLTRRSELAKGVRAGKLPARTVITGYILLVLLSTVVALALIHNRQPATNSANPFPAAQTRAAAFKLYYPARLPKDYQIDIASAESIETSVVVLRITNPKTGDAIAISQQKAPANFNFNVLYNSFEGKKSYNVKLGTVTEGTIDNAKTQIASLVTTDKTWIFLTAPGSVSDVDMRQLLVNLELVKDTD